jgi:type IV fimbrial biogenesis protein FimT
MLMRGNKCRESGFTLIELMIAVSIIVVLAALAAPSYRIMIQNNQIRNAAESINNGIQLARADAVNRNASVQFDFRGTNSAWTVCASPVVPGNCPATDDATTVQSRKASDGATTNVAVTPSVAGPYVFNSFGVLTPAPLAGTVSIDVDNSTLSAAESRNLRVLIDVGGSSRMCDPDTGLSASDPRKCP